MYEGSGRPQDDRSRGRVRWGLGQTADLPEALLVGRRGRLKRHQIQNLFRRCATQAALARTAATSALPQRRCPRARRRRRHRLRQRPSRASLDPVDDELRAAPNPSAHRLDCFSFARCGRSRRPREYSSRTSRITSETPTPRASATSAIWWARSSAVVANSTFQPFPPRAMKVSSRLGLIPVNVGIGRTTCGSKTPCRHVLRRAGIFRQALPSTPMVPGHRQSPG